MSLVGIVLFTVFPQSSVVFRMPTNPGTYGSTIFINFYFLWGSEGVLVSDCADCTLESEAPLGKLSQSSCLYLHLHHPTPTNVCQVCQTLRLQKIWVNVFTYWFSSWVSP